MKKTFIRTVLVPLLTSVLVLGLIAAGALHRVDKWTQDTLYQQKGTASTDIIIIGIDETTLTELGPYGLNYRGYIAYALQALAADPDRLPAVVAVDILYEGESGNAVDDQLARSAAALPRIVTACMANYGNKVTWEDGRATSFSKGITSVIYPYTALRDVTTQGHINAMSDKDGVLRHALLYITNPDTGETIYSMAAEVARLYLESRGKTLTLPSVNTAGHYYVPFTGGPGTYSDGYTLYHLLMGNIDPDAWAGKIVLIGPYAASMQDQYLTSAAPADPMFGVEYQANVIQSLMQGNLKTEGNDLVQFILLALLCLIAAFLFFRLNTKIGGAICAGIVFVSVLGSWGFWLAGRVEHVLWLPVGAVALYLAAVISHYIQASRERRALALEKERISTELALATRIQNNYLPKTFPPFPDRHEFDIYASMTPAREVGGDLYDFFLIDEDHLCLVIGDVSGKGVPASLFMMLSSALIHHVAMHELSPAKILSEVNAEICNRNPEEMFVTVWLGVLQISTGLLTAASAGHEYPAICHPGGSFELLKDKHGFVLGGMQGIRYREYTLDLEPGTRLFVYTDGVPEATDANNQMYGTDRMIDALRTVNEKDPGEILSAVHSSVQAFVGPAEQFDDLTMLCLEYRGPKNSQ